MPSLLARRHIFVAGNLIRSSEWNEELDQLYAYLAGVQAGSLLLVNDTPNDVFYIMNAGPQTRIVIEFRVANSPVVQINNSNQLKVFTTTLPPFIIASTTKVVGLDAEFLDGKGLNQFHLTGKQVETFISFMFDGLNVSGQETATFIVPQGTNMSIRSFEVSSSVRNGVYPDGGADFTITLRKNGALVSSLFCAHPVFGNSSTFNIAVVENDLITVIIDTVNNGGGADPREIAARVKFRQDLVS